MDTEKPFRDLEHLKNQACVIASIEKIAKKTGIPVILKCKPDSVSIEMGGERGEGANAIEALRDVKRKLRLEYQVEPS